ncbi:phenol 2-monooxygenase [Aureobasidium namibiae CBS 147.97]|uniref:Phenol 2-monooxygenase n=1 Tax=Aureobasidium namibiae CBS 147.97 TaxID=1043004 RepID=A0A074WM98_9PEZI
MSSSTSEVDLLIIGAGPAGLMAAAWASSCKLNARIIDEKDARVRTGQADGLHCRTLEIMDSFGSPSIAHEILGQACVIKEISSWAWYEDCIERSESIRSGEEDLLGSRYPQVSLCQGSVEQAFLNFLERDGDSIRIERNLTPLRLHVDQAQVGDHHAYPVEVHVQQLRDDELASPDQISDSKMTAVEIVRAKYVLGTDGAHSWTRKALGLRMEGDRTNKHFAVMDLIPLSDFPDIRISCVIHSLSGSIMTLPREGGLVRFYVQLGESSITGRDFDRSTVSADDIIKIARKIMHPYTLDYDHCDWFSVYTVGQRLAEIFSHHDRVFLAGDAVHTHSPTMGAGMNVSMQDSYNLVWKIVTAIRTGNRSILATYNTERLAVAKELMVKDRAMSDFYCDGPSVNSKSYQKFREDFRDFVSGVAVQYSPTILTSPVEKDPPEHKDIQQPHRQKISSMPSLATNLVLGQRIPSYLVTNHFTAEVVHLHSALKSTGHWRILLFPGTFSGRYVFERYCDLGQRLEAPNSFVRTCTPISAPIDSIIEVLTIHTDDRNDFDALSLPNIFHPWRADKGHQYWRIFAKDNDQGEDVYKAFGIYERIGCAVVVRPDQHVAYIGDLWDLESLGRFFENILALKNDERDRKGVNV